MEEIPMCKSWLVALNRAAEWAAAFVDVGFVRYSCTLEHEHLNDEHNASTAKIYGIYW